MNKYTTWSARGYRSIINYVFVNKKINWLVQDIRVHKGSDLDSDNFLVIVDITLLRRWKQEKLNKNS